MRKVLVTCAIAALAVLVAGGVTAKTPKEAPETIKIDDCQAKKSAVDFPHAKHQKSIECTTCHHTQEKLTADSTETVKPCSECHLKPEKAETPVCSQMSLTKNHFHISCVGCHKKEIAKDASKKAPTKCDECHAKS